MGFKDDLTESLAKHLPQVLTTGYMSTETMALDLADKVHGDVTKTLYTEIVGATEEMVTGLLSIMLASAAQNGATPKVLAGLNVIMDSVTKSFTEERA